MNRFCRYCLSSLLFASIGVASATRLPATTDLDPTLPSITANGYRFHAQSFGDRSLPVLVVLHGGPGADHRYLLGLRALAEVRRVVFYDQRGTGLSPRVAAEAISVDGYLDDLDAIMDHVSPDQPVDLLGHSWGAMLASAYTGRHPERVGRLVLAEPGFLDTKTMANAMSGGWPSWPVIWGMVMAWLSQWSIHTDSDVYARRDHLIGRMLPLFQAGSTCDRQVPSVEHWRAGSPAFDATIGRMRADPSFAATLNFRYGVEAFAGPVLFLTGACSPHTGQSQQRHHVAHFKRSTLVELPDAGHYMFNDQPEAAIAEVKRFLATP